MSIAASFAKKCEQIWEDDPENLYEDFHNAKFLAKHKFGGEFGSPTSHEGTKGNIWIFPDNSRIFISNDGSMIAPRAFRGKHEVTAKERHMLRGV